MYISGPEQEQKKEAEQKEKMEKFFSSTKPEEDINKAEEEKSFRNEAMEKIFSGALLRWRAPEYEKYERGRKWYLYVALVLLAIIGYAVYTDSPIMAITFVLIGVVGYIFLNREPRTIDFAVTQDGIIAGREMYDFDNIKSFWIFYEPHDIKVVSLHTKSMLMPFVHIPIHDEDPVEIRRVLLEYIPEAKQDPSLVDTFERLLGI
ncbi:MAG: hypothetical protein WC608_04870 [Parcubacteria group bacterium]